MSTSSWVPWMPSARRHARRARVRVHLEVERLERRDLLSVITPFTPRFTTNAPGDIVFVANTLMTAPASDPNAAGARAGTGPFLNNNDFNMTFVDVDNDPSTFDSSRATLSLPTGASVLWAGLYWGGRSSSSQRDQALLATPGATSYARLSGTVIGASGADYEAFKDVTAQVQAAGSGTYTVANVQATTGFNQYAGWSLVVVLRDPAAPVRNLAVFDGYANINSGDPPLPIPVSGFTTPPSGPVNARIGTVAFEGDRAFTGDALALNGTPLRDAVNAPDNFFNGEISRLGVEVGTKDPNYSNQLGFDAKIVDASGLLHNGDTSATLVASTAGDQYFPGAITTAVDIFAPQISATKSVVDVRGGPGVVPGDVLEYSVVVHNGGGDGATNAVLHDIIPAHTSYVPGSLVIGSGANAGTLTDQAGDDQADYNAALNEVFFRLGTGASALNGGALGIGDSTTVKFRVRVDSTATSGTTIINQAGLDYLTFTTATALSTNSTVNTVSVANVNAPPVNSVPGSQSARQGRALTFSSVNGNALALSDPDAGSAPVQVTLTATNGTLTLSGTTGLNFSVGSGSGDAIMTFTGTLADINAALDGLTFRNTALFSGAASLSVLTNDLGHNGGDGPKTAASTVPINVIPLVPPTNSVPGTQSVKQGVALTFSTANGNALSLSDADAGTSPVEVTLSAVGGTLSLGSTTGLSFVTGTGTADATVTFTGTLANVNAALDGLTFTSANRFSGSGRLTFLTNDLGHGGVAIPQTASSIVAVDVLPLTPPTNSVPGAQSTKQGVPLTFSAANGNALSLSDADAGTSPVEVTLTAVGGMLSLRQTSGLTFSAGTGTADATVTFTGTLTNVNAALNGLLFKPANRFRGSGSLTVRTSDLGHGSIGTPQTASSTVPVDVLPLTPPVNTVPAPQSTNQGTSLTFSRAAGNAISVGDVDAGSSPVRVTLTAANGTLTLARTSGLTFSTGTGTDAASVSFTGNLADVNAALDGLMFAPAAGFNGAARVSVLSDDLGHAGVADPQTAAATVSLDVVPAPPAAGNFTVTVPENSSDNPVDVLGHASNPGNQSLKVSSVSQAAHGQVAMTVDSRGVTYTPDKGFSGIDAFGYTIGDPRGQSSQGVVTVNVIPAKQPPIVRDDQATVSRGGGPTFIDVLANDTDPSGERLTIIAASELSSGTGGSIAISNGGRGLIYTPGSAFLGTDVIRYTVSDGSATGSATLSVTVVENPTSAFIVLENTITLQSLADTGGFAATAPSGAVARSTQTPTGPPGVTTVAGPTPGQGVVPAVLDPAVGNESRGAISGFVFEDPRNAGRRDQGDPGIAGQAVILEVATDGAFRPVRNGVTNADGSYSFTDLTPGTYRVRFTPPADLTTTGPAAEAGYTEVVNQNTRALDRNFGVRPRAAAPAPERPQTKEGERQEMIWEVPGFWGPDLSLPIEVATRNAECDRGHVEWKKETSAESSSIAPAAERLLDRTFQEWRETRLPGDFWLREELPGRAAVSPGAILPPGTEDAESREQ